MTQRPALHTQFVAMPLAPRGTRDGLVCAWTSVLLLGVCALSVVCLVLFPRRRAP